MLSVDYQPTTQQSIRDTHRFYHYYFLLTHPQKKAASNEVYSSTTSISDYRAAGNDHKEL